jgi:hypothetical protein
MAWVVSRTAIALAVFAAVSALAQLFGATNLGTALAFGQMAFALTVTLLIVKT